VFLYILSNMKKQIKKPRKDYHYIATNLRWSPQDHDKILKVANKAGFPSATSYLKYFIANKILLT